MNSDSEMNNVSSSPEDVLRSLRIAERRLANMQSLTHVGGWEQDLRTEEIWCSDEAFNIAEIDDTDTANLMEVFYSRVHPDDRPAARQAYLKSIERHEPYAMICRLLMPDGRIKHVRLLGHTQYDGDGNPRLAAGIIQDVTAQLDAEQRAAALERNLRESEERLIQAVAVAQLGFYVYDIVNNSTFWSVRMRAILGLGPDDVMSFDEYHARWHPDEQERLLESSRRAHDPTGDGVWSETYRFIRRDGSVCWLTARAQVYFEGEGEARHPVRRIGTISDVTELQEATTRAWIRDASMDQALNAMAIGDDMGGIIYANPALARLWGYDTPRDIVGLVPENLIDPAATAQVLAEVRSRGSFQGEVEAIRKDGSTFPVLVAASEVRDIESRAVYLMASFVDLTDEKRLQEQFLQAQKMESIGRLAGGIAHDFNNLLTVISGHTELALESISAGDPLSEDLNAIGSAAKSAARLTEQLLTFSRRQVIRPEIIDLAGVISQVHSMLARVLGEDITLEVRCEPDLGRVRFDRVQCEQILMNLVVNARDAMPHGGKLIIEAANEHSTHDPGGHSGILPARYVRLSVTDTGTGLSDQAREHLFEPFFTTKEPGRGTGLGLAMVFGAVSQNGGRVEVHSESGMGSTFNIFLPRVDAPLSTPTPAFTQVSRGMELLVLVEDDEAVRSFTNTVLTRHGYQVMAFANGTSALDALSNVPDTDGPDLLITDVIMPGMNGHVLASRLSTHFPGLRILFCSGYNDDSGLPRGPIPETTEFLQKPFTSQALLHRVRAMLDSGEPRPDRTMKGHDETQSRPL